MNEIVTINNVRGYIDEKGTAWLNLEDVAKGLGITDKAKSGNRVVRWARLKEYLKEFGIATCGDGVGKENLPEYIQENIFYKLLLRQVIHLRMCLKTITDYNIYLILFTL